MGQSTPCSVIGRQWVMGRSTPVLRVCRHPEDLSGPGKKKQTNKQKQKFKFEILKPRKAVILSSVFPTLKVRKCTSA
jgi:hypothetical protein